MVFYIDFFKRWNSLQANQKILLLVKQNVFGWPKMNRAFLIILSLSVQLQNQNLPPLEETSHPCFHLPAAAVRGLILVAPISIFIPLSLCWRLSSVVSEFAARVWYRSLSSYLGYLTKELLSLPGQQPACLQALQLCFKPWQWHQHLETLISSWPW